MRLVVQRVSEARVDVAGETVGAIGPGLVVLVGAAQEDDESHAAYLAKKTVNLRIFEDDEGKMNRSLLDTRGQILAVSQFTLYGDVSRGRRPSFIKAAPPERAEQLFDHYVNELRRHTDDVETGRFGAKMRVFLVNNGPVTLILDHPDTA